MVIINVSVLEELTKPNAHYGITNRVIETHQYQIGAQS